MDKLHFKLSRPVQALFLLWLGQPRTAYSSIRQEAGLPKHYSQKEYLVWARRR